MRTRAVGSAARTGDRKSFLPQVVSVLTAITAVLAILISWLTFRMDREGRMSARYTTAVEHFGNENPQTRTGAVYSLGRIAVESPKDRRIIIGMLTDFVKAGTSMGNADPAVCYTRGAPPSDVLAALRVLFLEIDRKAGDGRIDLRRICLANVEMPDADLTCMRLDQSVIAYSNFDRATFVDASLQHAMLGGNSFVEADLTRADAFSADFANVDSFVSTDLTRARLREAELVEADLSGADLTGADFTRARLDRADLKDTDVSDARMATYLGAVRNLPPDIDRSGALTSTLSGIGRSGPCS